MENELTVIDERNVFGKNVKIYGTFDEPLFVARDVAEWIGYSTDQVNKLVAMADESEKLTRLILWAGQLRKMWFLTEDGLYEVLMQSRMPTAKEFKKQIKTILKSIRKTGGYIAGQETLSDEQFLAKALGVAHRILAERDKALQNALQEKEQILVQNEDLKIQIGNSTDWKQVKAIKWLKDFFDLKNKGVYISIGSALTKISDQMNYNVFKVEDSTWGSVNVYHMDVIAVLKSRLMSDLNMMKKYRT